MTVMRLLRKNLMPVHLANFLVPRFISRETLHQGQPSAYSAFHFGDPLLPVRWAVFSCLAKALKAPDVPRRLITETMLQHHYSDYV